MKMKRIVALLIMFFLNINLTTTIAFAKTYAWLINTMESKAQKLDIAANKIIFTKVPAGLRTSTSLQEIENAIVADLGNNLLFVIYDYPGRFMGQGIKIFNLKDLTLKKDLGITSRDPKLDLPKVIVPPSGNKFYIIWWDRSKEMNNQGGETYSVYDKTTLNKISDLPTFPIDLNQPWMYSSDTTKLYSTNINANEIKVYDSNTLQLVNTLIIPASIWGSPLFFKGLESDLSYLGIGDNLFLFENIKQTASDPANIRFFIYNIVTKKISAKVAGGKEAGNKIITPNGSKIIFNEIEYVYIEPNVVKEIKHLNKVNIYDSTSGQRLKYLNLSNSYKSIGISGISPNSLKLYLSAENIQTGATTLIVTNLESPYDIKAHIPVEGTWMIFFEE